MTMVDRSFMSIADVNQMIEHLKHAPKELVKGYYFVRIRPDVRDRIVELLKKQQKELSKLKETAEGYSGLYFEAQQKIDKLCSECDELRHKNNSIKREIL